MADKLILLLLKQCKILPYKLLSKQFDRNFGKFDNYPFKVRFNSIFGIRLNLLMENFIRKPNTNFLFYYF